MRKLFFALMSMFLLMSIHAEKKLVIQFLPSENFDSDISFINRNGYKQYSNLVESLLNGKKIWFTGQIPKTGILEGRYQLFIYDDNQCIGQYDIINNDFVYNHMKGCYQKKLIY